MGDEVAFFVGYAVKLMAIKALLIDLDDTLVNATTAYSASLKAIRIGGKSEAFLKARAEVKKRLGSGHVSSRNRILYFKEMLEHADSYSPRRLLELMQRYELALEEHFRGQWGQLKRVDLFAAITAKYPLALITNENLRTQMVKLRALDPESKFFNKVVVSEEYGVEKPDHKLFQIALEKLGFAASEVLMIGDNFSADIVPAVELGMSAWWTREFPDRPDLSEQLEFCKNKGVRLISALEEMRELLK